MDPFLLIQFNLAFLFFFVFSVMPYIDASDQRTFLLLQYLENNSKKSVYGSTDFDENQNNKNKISGSNSEYDSENKSISVNSDDYLVSWCA